MFEYIIVSPFIKLIGKTFDYSQLKTRYFFLFYFFCGKQRTELALHGVNVLI